MICQNMVKVNYDMKDYLIKVDHLRRLAKHQPKDTLSHYNLHNKAH